MPASSVASAIAPPRASISLTRWPLPMPPIEGLHDIWPSVSTACVSSSVRAPERADASAASVPAWPPRTTKPSKGSGKSIGKMLPPVKPEVYAKAASGPTGSAWNNLSGTGSGDAVPRGTSLANAEAAEDPPEQVVCAHCSGDLPQLAVREPQLFGLQI